MQNARLEPGIKTGKLDQACKRYNVGRHTMRALAEEAGAVVWVGRCLLINFDTLDRYMDAMTNK